MFPKIPAMLLVLLLVVCMFVAGIVCAHILKPSVDTFTTAEEMIARCNVAMEFYWSSGKYNVAYNRYDGSANGIESGKNAGEVVVNAIKKAAPSELERKACAEYYESSVKDVCVELGDSAPEFMHKVCKGY
ncbi:hypothetical protein TetV_528 [Tetraselmis virus 1]|uniref:Uncharacterized protein n=1 Tax=Tetraselmis virus 1 TaxID=2060617 RepID=A0A2P0VP18_9VIRU|nr:hypothetical protein QJ968_gp526 [Tetraselmis virus 1]AUF82610.1 hypothetical protein TetV_528 [Tetraselmis virus 1]